jgi:molybdenum cofactor guanylyltransferase
MLKSELTGLVIAGGKGSRMGTEKGLIQFGGKPLIIYPIELLKQVCSDVMISANTTAYDFLKLKVVPDITPGGGPMQGIYSGLIASSSRYVFVLSCDMPLINSGLIEHLTASSYQANAVVAFQNGFAEPLCGIYNRDLIPEMKNHIAEKKFKLISFLEDVNARFVRVDGSLPFYSADLFLNVNTPGDLLQGEKLLSEK